MVRNGMLRSRGLMMSLKIRLVGLVGQNTVVANFNSFYIIFLPKLALKQIPLQSDERIS